MMIKEFPMQKWHRLKKRSVCAFPKPQHLLLAFCFKPFPKQWKKYELVSTPDSFIVPFSSLNLRVSDVFHIIWIEGEHFQVGRVHIDLIRLASVSW